MSLSEMCLSEKLINQAARLAAKAFKFEAEGWDLIDINDSLQLQMFTHENHVENEVKGGSLVEDSKEFVYFQKFQWQIIDDIIEKIRDSRRMIEVYRENNWTQY